MKSDPTRIDPLKLKLGKQPARHDPRTLLFATYATAALPAPPPSLNLTTKIKVPWGMMDNAQLGDCTCAAAGHLIMEWTANAQSKIFTPSDPQIVAAYSAITGYNPKTGANDNGAQEIDVLNYWRQPASPVTRFRPSSRSSPPTTPIHGWDWIFGGCYIGLALAQERPGPDQQQAALVRPSRGTWGDGVPGSWGGHAVPVVAYDSRSLTVVTWGALQTMTWGFWAAYCDEAYAILSPDFLEQKGGQTVDANGFNLSNYRRTWPT